MAIDWGLLHPANIGGALQAGIEAGRATAKQQATDNALAAYGAHPSVETANALFPYAPQVATAALSNIREDAKVTREAQGRAAYSTYLRENGQGLPAAPGAPSVAATAVPVVPASDGGVTPPAESAPVDPNGDIVVTGRKPPAPIAPTTSLADVAEFSPDLAQQLTQHMGALDKNGREQFAQKSGVAAAVALAASHLPYDQRQAFIDDHTPVLREAGWTDAELAQFDPHDENLRATVALGVGADKALADDRAAAGQAVSIRGQDVSAATSRRGQDISASTAMRGQDIGAATARAGQAVMMRGQDIMATSRAAPKPATVALARSKLSSLNAISNQLNRAEAALNKAKYTGPVGGRLSGGFSGADDAADTAISGLAPLVRQLTRVPGEGAMSDYESRLANAGLPSRKQTRQGRQEAIDQLRALVNQSRAGYHDLLGEDSSPANRGFKVVR